MRNFTYKKRRFFSGPHLIGLIFIVAGLFTMLSPAFLNSDSSLEQTFFLSLEAMALGCMLVTFYEGTAIDFNQKSMKEFTAFMGYRFGDWKPLPALKKVAVAEVNYKTTNTPNGISPTLSGEVTDYTVFVYADNPKPVYAFRYAKEEQAVKAGKLLSANLGVLYVAQEA